MAKATMHGVAQRGTKFDYARCLTPKFGAHSLVRVDTGCSMRQAPYEFWLAAHAGKLESGLDDEGYLIERDYMKSDAIRECSFPRTVYCMAAIIGNTEGTRNDSAPRTGNGPARARITRLDDSSRCASTQATSPQCVRLRPSCDGDRRT